VLLWGCIFSSQTLYLKLVFLKIKSFLFSHTSFQVRVFSFLGKESWFFFKKPRIPWFVFDKPKIPLFLKETKFLLSSYRRKNSFVSERNKARFCF
jgi:hypothetical protein